MAATHAASEHWRSQRAGAEASKSETTGDRVHALRLKQTSPADQAPFSPSVAQRPTLDVSCCLARDTGLRRCDPVVGWNARCSDTTCTARKEREMERGYGEDLETLVSLTCSGSSSTEVRTGCGGHGYLAKFAWPPCAMA